MLIFSGEPRGRNSQAICKRIDLPGLKHSEKLAESVFPADIVQLLAIIIIITFNERGD